MCVAGSALSKVLSPNSVASTVTGNWISGTTPACWVVSPSTRKNCAMVSLTWPNFGPCLVGQRSRSIRFCTVPLPKVGSPTIRPRP
jgi:hypothetical protein